LGFTLNSQSATNLPTDLALGIKPCGPACDTLRLEAAMPLYGHELTEDIDPITAAGVRREVRSPISRQGGFRDREARTESGLHRRQTDRPRRLL
jgi:aminomethyltransferase